MPPIDAAAMRRRDPRALVQGLAGETMGTTWTARIVAPPAGIERALEAELAAVIAAMSQWEPQSAISRFNRAPVGSWQPVPASLAKVLQTALAIHAASDGAFDPAGGALSNLWGFGASGRRADVPGDPAIEAALARSGGSGIECDGQRARRLRDVALDLSGIAKGFAVDQLAQRCRALGCRDFLVEIGGEFVGAGVKPDGQPWWIDLEDPPGVTLPPLRVALHERGLATSGDYRRFIACDGRRLSHTLDPRTGRPIDNRIVSVSVIAADCMTADAWATALTVLGRDAGLSTAERHRLAARIVTDDGREALSTALAEMIGSVG